MRKRGHGCHAPRVKPTINREVKLLRYSLVHRSLAFARKSLHLSLCAEQPCPARSHGNISAEYIRSLVFFSFFFFSPSKFSPHEFTTRFEGTKERESISKRGIEFHRGRIGDAGSALTTNPSKSDKAASTIVSQPRSVLGHRGKGRSKKEHRGREEKFITLFEACLSTADSARGS